MSKIFISFFDGITDPNNPNAMSCHYESLLKEFKNAGNDILYFDHKIWNKDFGKTPKYFIKKIQDFNPNLVILFDNRCYNDLYKYVDCPIIIWEADSYLYFSNIEEIKKNPNRYHYIVGQTILVKKIKEAFNIASSNIHYLPSATSIIAENIPQTTNISFIGTKFNSPDIVSEFMHNNPNKIEIEQFKNLLDYTSKFPFITDQEIFKKFKINSNKIKNTFSVRNALATLSVKNRIQILSAAADLGLDLYGPENWINDLLHEPDLVLSYQNKLIYTLKENQDIYNSSKISININHAQAQTGFSWRVCDIMASNACLVTEYKKDLDFVFPNIKIPTFTNKYEAHQICQKLLKEDNLRREIVHSCQEIINKKYRYVNLLTELESILKIKLVYKKTGKLNRLTEQKKIIDRNINIIYKTNRDVNKKNNLRILTRAKLVLYSTFMVINQIPIINKPLMCRDEILNKITKTIKNDKIN